MSDMVIAIVRRRASAMGIRVVRPAGWMKAPAGSWKWEASPQWEMFAPDGFQFQPAGAHSLTEWTPEDLMLDIDTYGLEPCPADCDCRDVE